MLQKVERHWQQAMKRSNIFQSCFSTPSLWYLQRHEDTQTHTLATACAAVRNDIYKHEHIINKARNNRPPQDKEEDNSKGNKSIIGQLFGRPSLDRLLAAHITVNVIVCVLPFSRLCMLIMSYIIRKGKWARLMRLRQRQRAQMFTSRVTFEFSTFRRSHT